MLWNKCTELFRYGMTENKCEIKNSCSRSDKYE